MPTFTGIADSNGDFVIPFSAEYTAGQKVIVTAEKDGATKSIELFAPSEVVGGGVIQFSGTLTNFPTNVGIVSIVGISGKIAAYSFGVPDSTTFGIGAVATGLILGSGITELGPSSFQGWKLATTLTIASTVTILRDRCFSAWSAIKKVTIPASVTLMESYAFYNWTACDEITCLATNAPSITNLTFSGLKSTCIFKVPAGSVSAYQAAPSWSAFSSRIQAI
ncbi:hypothetical protein D3C78_672600 [compost metagenome]